MPGGRPTTYTPELGDRIATLVSTHTNCLDELVELYPDLPCPASIYLWRHKHPEFSEKYLQAMQNRGNLYAEETIKIASQKPTYFDSDGNERVDAGAVAWLKMNVNLRLWHASKLAPKIYGDRKEIDKIQDDHRDIKAELQALRAQLAEQNKREY